MARTVTMADYVNGFTEQVVFPTGAKRRAHTFTRAVYQGEFQEFIAKFNAR